MVAPAQGSLEKLTKLRIGLYSLEVLFSDEFDTFSLEQTKRKKRVTWVLVWQTILIRRN